MKYNSNIFYKDWLIILGLVLFDIGLIVFLPKYNLWSAPLVAIMIFVTICAFINVELKYYNDK
ncbi:hypothetical protein M0R04_08420 [Candidatus Dojkabacteria bacterium]|jgi:hypothetical protein|nr:hypothetical protein [Candidatus Dojkabacteria bacterium]